jgi:hypothetical protein
MVIEDEEDLILKSMVELPNNIQMTRGLTFAEYVEHTNEKKLTNTLQLEESSN